MSATTARVIPMSRHRPAQLRRTLPVCTVAVAAAVLMAAAASCAAPTQTPQAPGSSAAGEPSESPGGLPVYQSPQAVEREAAAEAGELATRPGTGPDAVVEMLAPGSPITLRAPAAAATPSSTCTLGPVLDGEDGQTYALTAGHCTAGGEHTEVTWSSGGEEQVVGDVVDFDEASGWGAWQLGRFDFALIRLSGVAAEQVSSEVGGMYPVAGTVSPGDVDAEAVVCAWGMRTGESCGHPASVDAEGRRLTAGVPGTLGDSGGPVYVIGDSGEGPAAGVRLLGIRTQGTRGLSGVEGIPAVLAASDTRASVSTNLG